MKKQRAASIKQDASSSKNDVVATKTDSSKKKKKKRPVPVGAEASGGFKDEAPKDEALISHPAGFISTAQRRTWEKVAEVDEAMKVASQVPGMSEDLLRRAAKQRDYLIASA